MQPHPHDRRAGMRLLRDALISFVVLFLVFAAFDDITTDNATRFTVEYTVLIACAAWLGWLALGLIRSVHRTLGLVSLAALAGALWGQRGIGPGITPGLWPAYVVTTGAFLWFVALAMVLLVLGVRIVSRTPAASGRSAGGDAEASG